MAVTEIADGIHLITTYLPEAGMGFNQYVVAGDEPLLFHTGMRSLFPAVVEGVGRVVGPEQLRWLGFGHVEADECGAMNEWLALAPSATVVQSRIGCAVSIGDLADRAPEALDDGATLDLGGHVLRWIDTPHLPHAWEAGLFFDETTRTLLCGDLFAWSGEYGATTDDLVGPAVRAEDEMPGSLSLHPGSAALLHRLADLEPATLAPMHAPAFTGDCATALRELAADFDRRQADAGTLTR
jgi:flavorubredoxin